MCNRGFGCRRRLSGDLTLGDFPFSGNVRGPQLSRLGATEPATLRGMDVSELHSSGFKEKNWEHSGQEGIRKYLCFPNYPLCLRSRLPDCSKAMPSSYASARSHHTCSALGQDYALNAVTTTYSMMHAIQVGSTVLFGTQTLRGWMDSQRQALPDILKLAIIHGEKSVRWDSRCSYACNPNVVAPERSMRWRSLCSYACNPSHATSP